MTQTDIYLSVIVPAYNEAARIGKTLDRLQQYLTQAAIEEFHRRAISGEFAQVHKVPHSRAA